MNIPSDLDMNHPAPRGCPQFDLSPVDPMRPPTPNATDPTLTVHLWSRRTIQLKRLVRDPVVLDVPERAPTQENVDRLMREAVEWAQRCFKDSGPAGGPLVAPAELLTGPGRQRLEEVGYLPAWVSCGLFESTRPTEGGKGCRSQLIVVWFQDFGGTVMDGPFLSWLCVLDWDIHAVNLPWGKDD